MKKINWGIIGCGDVCEVKSGPAFKIVEDSFLQAVMRRDPEKVKEFAQRHGVESYYTNADDIIYNQEVDAIYIATPPSTHAPYAIKALQAGKPVYVEKPMALNYNECNEMIKVSEDTGVPLFVAYYRRFFPFFLKIKQIIDSEQIGTLLTANLTTVLPPRKADFDKANPPWHLIPKIAGGGYFFDMACHQLDILDFLLGPVEDVHGFFTNRAGIYEIEDTLSATLKFKSGPLASCSWNYVGNADNSIDRMEIIGTKGMLSFSINADKPFSLKTGAAEKHFSVEKPKHVELPMIEQVTLSLLGKNELRSNMESAARTAWVMDKIMGRE